MQWREFAALWVLSPRCDSSTSTLTTSTHFVINSSSLLHHFRKLFPFSRAVKHSYHSPLRIDPHHCAFRNRNNNCFTVEKFRNKPWKRWAPRIRTEVIICVFDIPRRWRLVNGFSLAVQRSSSWSLVQQLPIQTVRCATIVFRITRIHLSSARRSYLVPRTCSSFDIRKKPFSKRPRVWLRWVTLKCRAGIMWRLNSVFFFCDYLMFRQSFGIRRAIFKL